MRKLILYMLMTVDGFVSGPNDEFDDFEPSFEEHVFANQLFSSMDTVVFGRKTWEAFTGYWDQVDLGDITVPAQEVDFARVFRGLERVVISRTVSDAGKNTIVIRDEIEDRINQLKARPGRDMILVCGPELLSDLMKHELIDEFILMIKPRVLGEGKGLFRNVSKKFDFRLQTTKEFQSGTVMHWYASTANV